MKGILNTVNCIQRNYHLTTAPSAVFPLLHHRKTAAGVHLLSELQPAGTGGKLTVLLRFMGNLPHVLPILEDF